MGAVAAVTYLMDDELKEQQELYDRGYQMIMVMADGVALAKLAADNVTLFGQAFPGDTTL